MKLKVSQIKNAKAGASLQDGGGLFIKITKEGQGRWYYRYQHQKRRRDLGLGSYPAISLADARQERARWAAVLQSGLDPIAERDRLREEAERGALDDPTFADMVDMVFEANKAKLRGAGERSKWLSRCVFIWSHKSAIYE